MGALALALSVQPPTITKMVVRLSSQGMVERRPSPDDGRSSKVFLTEKGSQLIGDLDTRLKRMDQDALKGFEGKERKRLRKALIQLEDNLSGDIEDDTASADSEPSAS